MEKALFWHKTDSGKIQCELCPHHCVLDDNQSGLCSMRHVRNGVLSAQGYGMLSSVHSDPIEKKPLYHFLPGTDIFSIGGWGCNFACKFCQNWSISQKTSLDSQPVSPADIVKASKDHHSRGIAYTYNEPLINIEFVHDCSQLAKENGLKNILVTNGFVEQKPAEYFLPYIHALNIDIKSMDESFYKRQCRGRLEPVLKFAVQAVNAGCHVEITNLLIPGLNDNDQQIEKLSVWVSDNLGRQTPLHLSAYHPDYQMNLPSTSVAVLQQAYDICRRNLHYVYLGNTYTSSGQNTCCPKCGTELIARRGYSITINGIDGTACRKCGRPADVIME